MTGPTLCEGCGQPVPRRRVAKGFTRCRPCARASNRADWNHQRDLVKYLRSDLSPLSRDAKRALPPLRRWQRAP